MNSRFFSLCISICLIYIFYPESSYAYLDPGSASIFLQALIGGLVAGLALVINFWKTIKYHLLKVFKRSATDESKRK